MSNAGHPFILDVDHGDLLGVPRPKEVTFLLAEECSHNGSTGGIATIRRLICALVALVSEHVDRGGSCFEHDPAVDEDGATSWQASMILLTCALREVGITMTSEEKDAACGGMVFAFEREWERPGAREPVGVEQQLLLEPRSLACAGGDESSLAADDEYRTIYEVDGGDGDRDTAVFSSSPARQQPHRRLARCEAPAVYAGQKRACGDALYERAARLKRAHAHRRHQEHQFQMLLFA